MQTLELRLTHVYADTWRNEDEWKAIGEFEVTYTERWVKKGGDIQEPMKVIHSIHVQSEASVEEISKALQETFTMTGCTHEYDCCGCRSYHAKKPIRVSDDSTVWTLEVNSWRNY